jgi:hypothetical protein
MSVRATGRLVGELVKITGMGNSPEMVVKAVDEKTKMATAFWFLDNGEYRENTFSVDVIDRAEPKKEQKTAKTAKTVKSRAKK